MFSSNINYRCGEDFLISATNKKIDQNLKNTKWSPLGVVTSVVDCDIVASLNNSCSLERHEFSYPLQQLDVVLLFFFMDSFGIK